MSTQVLCRVGLSVESVQRPDDRDAIRFAVSDNGTGMDADTVERLLSPFAQVDQFTIRRFDGAGQGLSICKELADLMGGKVLVESELGVGTVFFLDLPAFEVATPPLVSPPVGFLWGDGSLSTVGLQIFPRRSWIK